MLNLTVSLSNPALIILNVSVPDKLPTFPLTIEEPLKVKVAPFASTKFIPSEPVVKLTLSPICNVPVLVTFVPKSIVPTIPAVFTFVPVWPFKTTVPLPV